MLTGDSPSFLTALKEAELPMNEDTEFRDDKLGLLLAFGLLTKGKLRVVPVDSRESKELTDGR